MTLPEPFGRRLRTHGRTLHDLDREFREWPVFAGWPFKAAAGAGTAPRVEVFELDRSIVIRAEVPGLTAADVRVTFDDSGLLIEGEFDERREEQGRNFYLCEREYGSFARRVPLAVEVVAEQAEIAVENGLLTLRVPRREPAAR